MLEDTKRVGENSVLMTLALSLSDSISQATMFDLFRKGEVLPTGRTDAEEKNLVLDGQPKNQNGQQNQTAVKGNGTVPPAAATRPQVRAGQAN